MTAQYPEIVICENEDFDGLFLYRLLRGTPDAPEPFAFQTPPTPPDNIVCSAVGRGYVAEIVVDHHGNLTLRAFRYIRFPEYSIGPDGFAIPHGDEWDIEPVHETLIGDFWLDFRTDYFSPSVFVPVLDGKLVRDRSQWLNRSPMSD